jgi:hypothetical protein
MPWRLGGNPLCMYATRTQGPWFESLQGYFVGNVEEKGGV